MATIGSLSVKLGLVTVEWDQATEKAKKQAKDLQTAFNNLGTGFKKASDLWKEFGGVIGAVSIGGLIQQTIQLTAEIKDLSEGFGITVSQTLAFRDALMGAGADAASAGKMMSTLFAKIDDAQQGNDKAVAQFEKLGITFKEIKETDPYDMILRVAQGFDQITNKAEKAKLVKEFFSKAGIQLDIKEVSAVLAEGTDRFDKYAEGIKAVGQISDNLAKNFENLKIAFAQLMAPFADTSVVKIETYLKILQAIAAGGIALGVMKIAVAFFELSKAILAANAAGALFNATAGGVSPIGLAIKLLAAGAAAIVFFSGGSADAAKGSAPSGPADVGGGADSGSEGSMTKEAMNKRSQVELTRELTKLDMERAKIQADFLNQDQLHNQLALSQLTMREKLLQIDQKLANELRSMGDDASKDLITQTKALASAEKIRATEEAYDREQLLRAKSLYEVKQKMFESEMNYLRSLGNIGADFEQETPEQIREAEDARIRARVGLSNQVKETARLTDLDNKRLEFSNGQLLLDERQATLAMERYDLEMKIADYRREAMSKGETNKTVIEAMVQTIRDAGEETIRLKQQTIDAQRTFEYGWTQAYNSFMDSATNAANQGRDVFNAFTNNMTSAIDNFVKTGKLSFKDLARSIIADLIAIQLKASVLGMFRGLSSIFSFGSGGSMVGADYSLSTGSSYGLKARAMGGDVSSNAPYIVGEQGPELFVPNRSGSIIPNHALANSMGGGTNVTNVNINAIDTKSFEERLMNSPNAIWAANQYANKSLAIGRGRS